MTEIDLGNDLVTEYINNLSTQKGALERIDKKDIIPDTEQVRRTIDQDALVGLKVTMELVGQQQNIVLYKKDNNGKYKIRHGERRWRAAMLSDKITHLEAIVLPFTNDEEPTAVRHILQGIENNQREALPLIEWALAVEKIVAAVKDRKVVANVIGKDVTYISRLLSVIKSPPVVKELAIKGFTKDVKIIAGLKNAHEINPEETETLINSIKDKGEIEGNLRDKVQELISRTKKPRKKQKIQKLRPLNAHDLGLINTANGPVLQVYKENEIHQYRVNEALLLKLIDFESEAIVDNQ